jgi:hypothetical protein
MTTSSPMQRSLVVSRKTLVWTAVALLALAGMGAVWFYLTHPPRPWLVRRQVRSYLRHHSSNPNFKVDFPFPSKSEMAKGPSKTDAAEASFTKGKRTGKDFDTLASLYLDQKTALVALERDVPESEAELITLRPRLADYAAQLTNALAAGKTNLSMLEARLGALQKRVAALEKTASGRSQLQAKQEALAPILADLWDFQRVWSAELEALNAAGGESLAKGRDQLISETRDQIRSANSYESIYRLIGQELWVAEGLLDSANPAHRRVGVSLAMDASHHAVDDSENGWLGGRICEGYIWANLDVATDSNRRSPFNLENLLDQCADIFRSNDEVATLVRNYRILLAKANTPQRADAIRVQIGMIYARNDSPKEALGYLRQVKATNDFRWAMNMIPRLEQQLKAGN